MNALYADGALPPWVGTHNIQILRATKDAPERAEDRGFIYNHHIGDLYYHDNTFYVTWGSGEVSEHRLPYRTVVSSSTDGFTWSKPAELSSRSARDPEDWKNAIGSPSVPGALQDAYRRAVEFFQSQFPTMAQVSVATLIRSLASRFPDSTQSLPPSRNRNHQRNQER
ncbi:MAG: hypothetical protein HUU20_21210 [Pirellulales bacterium]|nr:hypothetical protein [Pirellulales bacterium]